MWTDIHFNALLPSPALVNIHTAHMVHRRDRYVNVLAMGREVPQQSALLGAIWWLTLLQCHYSGLSGPFSSWAFQHTKHLMYTAPLGELHSRHLGETEISSLRTLATPKNAQGQYENKPRTIQSRLSLNCSCSFQGTCPRLSARHRMSRLPWQSRMPPGLKQQKEGWCRLFYVTVYVRFWSVASSVRIN